MNKKQFFTIFAGILIFLYYFYLRFLRLRQTGPINPEFTWLSIILYIFSISLTVLALITLTHLIILAVQDKKKMNAYIAGIIKKFKNFLQLFTFLRELIISAYDNLTIKIPKYNIFLEGAMNFWFNVSPYYRYISIFGIYLPSLIVAISFFIDVVINKNFHYFPKILIIMLLPFCIRLLHWIVKRECFTFCSTLQTILDRTEISPNRFTFTVRPETQRTHPELCEIVMANLMYYLNRYDDYSCKLEKYEIFSQGWDEKLFFFILTSSIWIINWATMIIYMIKNIPII
jgi:hypothetical protein